MWCREAQASLSLDKGCRDGVGQGVGAALVVPNQVTNEGWPTKAEIHSNLLAKILDREH